MVLTPEERQRIYEEEKAREEAHNRLKDEKRNRGCLGCLGVLVLLLIIGYCGSQMGASHNSPTSRAPTATDAPPASPYASKDELLKAVETMNAALQDMKTGITGQSMEHVKFALEVFNAGAKLLQLASSHQLDGADLSKAARLRSLLVLRQRQSFPVMRNRMGSIISKEMWIADGEARTFGTRFTVAQFVSAEFAAHSKIQTVQNTLHAMLVRLRFKQSRYKWYAEAEEYTSYAIESPTDGDVAIVDEQGTVTMVPQ